MQFSAIVLGLLCPAIVGFGFEPTLQFNRDIRPILSDKCFHCHAADAAAKKIPLRLDSETAAKADLGGRHAIVNGDSTNSELVRRITSENKAKQMPPVYSGLKLTSQEVETLRTWIEQGATWQKHWSFLPPNRPVLPKNTPNPIDAFVLSRLEREGLKPSAETDRATLLRRVTLDLTGVPPTVAEVDAFLRDTAANAYETVVDRLLQSPRYGERMAARWLDAARYADSNGYQYDGERVMWRWRDWVINAFNRNQRFDQFTLEQLAGDLVPNATLEQTIATGFNRNHRANTEDGIIPEEYAVEYVVDRVETTSTVFMGLTLGCARCHNHKYDPITQKEFYEIFAYFNNVPELGRAMKYGNSPPVVAAPTYDQQTKLRGLETRIDGIETFLKSREIEISRSQKAWEAKMAHSQDIFHTPAAGLASAFSLDKNSDIPVKDGNVIYVPGRIGNAAQLDGKSYFDAGSVAAFDIEDPFSISAWIYSDSTPDGSIVTRMEDKPQGKGYGIYVDQGKVHVHITSNYADDAIRLETQPILTSKRWHNVLVTYSGSRMAEGIHVYVDGQPVQSKILLDTLYRPFRNAGKTFREPLRIGAGGGNDRRFRGRLDDVRVYSRMLSDSEVSQIGAGESINAIAKTPAKQRTDLQAGQLREEYLDQAATPEIKRAWSQLIQLRLEKENFQRSFPTVMVMAESSVPKQTHLLVRGAYNAPGEVVHPGVPAVLPPLPNGTPNNRLSFAKWLIAPQNPLLARVTVNRFWQMYFGTGIVKTTEDFGAQGEWPSHPELLDWLATEFVRTGWDVKAMQKLIVTSAAYRQASKATPELMQKDPENRLLTRGPRLRLPAEMVRDQALFVSGLLTEKVGGPSVKPYQPAGLWKELSMQDMDYVQSTGGDLHRRSLYTYWKRTIAPPMMANFDSAMRESCVVRETRTNTPLQALNLMNDITFLEAARAIGQRMLKESGKTEEEHLRYGFRLVTGRIPSPAEEQILRDNLRYGKDYFSTKPERAQSYLKQGSAPTDPNLDPQKLAAYSSVASLLLNLDEVVTKE